MTRISLIIIKTGETVIFYHFLRFSFSSFLEKRNSPLIPFILHRQKRQLDFEMEKKDKERIDRKENKDEEAD